MDEFKTLEEYQRALEEGRYKDMCKSFCHEGWDFAEWALPDFILFAEELNPADFDFSESWVSVGTCSYQEKIMVKDLPGYPETTGYILQNLQDVPESEWPEAARAAFRRVGEWILAEIKRGRWGC